MDKMAPSINSLSHPLFYPQTNLSFYHSFQKLQHFYSHFFPTILCSNMPPQHPNSTSNYQKAPSPAPNV